MNVLFLSELFYPHGGGAEYASYLYAKLLSADKVNVVVITNRFDGEPDFSFDEGFAIYRLPLLKRKEGVKYAILQRVDVLISGFMRKWMRWADVVYVPRFWFSAIPVAKAYGKPVIVHLHDYIPICPLAVMFDYRKIEMCKKAGMCSPRCVYGFESRKRRFTKAAESTFLNLAVWPFLKRFIESSDAVVCVSKAQRNILTRHSPSLANMIRVIYNPLPPLLPVETEGDDFGYFGGSSFVKGFHVLLKALRYRKLHRRNPVTVHGTKFSNLTAQCIDSLNKLGLTVYGKVDTNTLGRLHKKIEAVVVPSIWSEPLPYVVAEAALRGQLVIASMVGGIPEQLDGCKGAFLFGANDYRQLTDHMDSISGMSKDEVVDLGSQNRQVMLKKFNNQKSIEDLRCVLDSIIDARY